jgi:uncharacterized protein YwbE
VQIVEQVDDFTLVLVPGDVEAELGDSLDGPHGRRASSQVGRVSAAGACLVDVSGAGE